jgi:hypothetical protein
LLEAQRPGGTDHREVIATLAALARAASTAEMSGGCYLDLLRASADVAEFARHRTVAIA